MNSFDRLMAEKSDEYCHCEDVRAGDTRIDENSRMIIHSKLVPRKILFAANDERTIYDETACGKPVITEINLAKME